MLILFVFTTSSFDECNSKYLRSIGSSAKLYTITKTQNTAKFTWWNMSFIKYFIEVSAFCVAYQIISVISVPISKFKLVDFSQILLERHVNNHFTESSPSNNGNKRTSEGGSVKLLRRNGKKLRYRRQPWSARMFDFFDPGMMEGLAYRLARCTRWRLGGSCPLREPAGRHTITLHAALTATRYNAQEARREALLTYYPPHVLEDEWVPEKEVTHIKRVEISQLPAATKVRLYEQFTSSYRKTPSPPPVKKEVFTPPPARTLPARHCTSSRLLNNLLKKKESKPDCSATNVPMIVEDETDKIEVSGAKKRKMGRRHGGNAFWPCGR